MTTEAGSTGIHCERCGRRTEVIADLVDNLNRAEATLALIEEQVGELNLKRYSMDYPVTFINGVREAMRDVRAILKKMKWSWEKKT